MLKRTRAKHIPPLHPAVRKALGYEAGTPDREVLSDWKHKVRTSCKPCWELKYCPYGPLVEQFPLPPITRQSWEDHDDYLRKCLETGRLGNGRKVDKKRRKIFEMQLRDYVPSDHPEEIPAIFDVIGCKIFGHICPVYFVAEPFTETKHRRSNSRSIPREIMLKVVRRDGQICQKCNEPVADDEVEFDHVIPFSRGGAATVENLRLVHRSCNRRKGASLRELLSEDPVRDHYFAAKNQRPKR